MTDDLKPWRTACRSCDGTGADLWKGNPQHDCPSCHGRGYVLISPIEPAARAVDDTYDCNRGGEITNIPQVAQAAITAYLAAIEAEGSVMVPVEPTGEMVREGAEPLFAGSGTKADAKAIEVYRAMIAARPKVEP